MDTKSYFNVLLLGRTGQGKSTLGNNLLKPRGSSKATDSDPDAHKETDHDYSSLAKRDVHKAIAPDYSSLAAAAQDTDSRFKEGMGYESCTRRCEVLSATGVRVLDTPGFADSDKVTEAGGIYRANLSMFRNIARKQVELKFAFDRVLYFLPERGCIEKVHGYLLEEIQVMHHFYGNAIFERMIVVATLDEFMQGGADQRLLEDKCKKAFTEALRFIKFTGTPPRVMFIPIHLSGEKLLQMIQIADGETHGGVSKCAFVDSVCARCAVCIVYQEGSKHTPENRICVRKEQEVVDYEQSKCHPHLIPRYSIIQKCHAVVGSILRLEFRRSIEFIHNDEEVCITCKKSPYFDGCVNVRTMHPIVIGKNRVNMYVDHVSDIESDICVIE